MRPCVGGWPWSWGETLLCKGWGVGWLWGHCPGEQDGQGQGEGCQAQVALLVDTAKGDAVAHLQSVGDKKMETLYDTTGVFLVNIRAYSQTGSGNMFYLSANSGADTTADNDMIMPLDVAEVKATSLAELCGQVGGQVTRRHDECRIHCTSAPTDECIQ